MPYQCLLHLGMVLALSGPHSLPSDVPTFNIRPTALDANSCFDACQEVGRAEAIASLMTEDIGQCGRGALERSHVLNAGLPSESGRDAPYSDRCMVIVANMNEVAAIMSHAVADLYRECAPPPSVPKESCEVPVSPSNGKGSCVPHATFGIPAG